MTELTVDELDIILARHNGEIGVSWEDPDVVTPDTKKALLDWHNKELVYKTKEAEINGATDYVKHQYGKRCLEYLRGCGVCDEYLHLDGWMANLKKDYEYDDVRDTPAESRAKEARNKRKKGE